MAMLKKVLALTALLMVVPFANARDDLIAIDVLIQPDAKMVEEAGKWNGMMREQTPDGFELDAEHAPHITLLQLYVSQADLPKVMAAVDKAKSGYDLGNLEMTATGLYHIANGKVGLAGIVIKPTEQLRTLQQAMIDAAGQYAVKGGDASAFVPDKSGAAFPPALFEYVDTFIPHQTGTQYNPHVTIGVAPLDWLKALEAKPFEAFTFSARRIAIYQLGNYGTASKRLDSGQ
ncbi:2'-5' RNA ligase family protein [Pseudomonas vancouverensis]|uniref:2'-5' RNA ligase family protein n=1 Tax=Pseudomonas vancouverensis TaxID=95300 RepID=UPI003D0060C6